ncbi:MAG: hypothetical protein AB8B52_11885 [Winogradskyella sp.]|uniref:hypothetical protein n=1 Tax=Winogradskyella sp. TaxID=1883156 RepID=UPI00385AEF7E
MKTVCFISLFIMSKFCLGQSTLPTDLVLNDLNGAVKTVVEIVSVPNTPDVKKVYHFDRNGLLTTIDEYSEFLNEQDSLINNSIHHFENKHGERTFTVRDTKNRAITSTGTFKVLQPNVYSLDVNISKDIRSYSVFKFEANVLVDRINTIMKENGEEWVNMQLSYNYTDGLLDWIDVLDLTTKTKDTTHIENLGIDSYGNFQSQRYFDQSHTLVYEIKREINYYD